METIGQLAEQDVYTIALGLFPRGKELAFHAVVPVEVSTAVVNILDPLVGEVEMQRDDFIAAR